MYTNTRGLFQLAVPPRHGKWPVGRILDSHVGPFVAIWLAWLSLETALETSRFPLAMVEKGISKYPGQIASTQSLLAFQCLPVFHGHVSAASRQHLRIAHRTRLGRCNPSGPWRRSSAPLPPGPVHAGSAGAGPKKPRSRSRYSSSNPLLARVIKDSAAQVKTG